MFCENCGNKIEDGARFCDKCGTKCDVTKEKKTISSNNAVNNVLGHKYRFRCCVEAYVRVQIVALPLIYFLGDSVDFTFQENTLKILSSRWDLNEPYENIKNIYFQDNVLFRRNFPMIFFVLIAALILCCGEFDAIVIIAVILVLGLGVFLKFGNVKRTAIIVEYQNGQKLSIPLKKLKEKKLQLKESFLNDFQSIKNTISCENFENEIEDDAKSCENCGIAAGEPPTEPICSENTEQKTETIKGSGSANATAVKMKSTVNKKLIIALGIIIVVLAGIFVAGQFWKKNYQKQGDDVIQGIKDSHFAFLPEMTVGEIITEYYGEDNWAYNSDEIVEFWGTNQKDKSGLVLHFDSVKADNTVGVTYRMYHNAGETAHSISESEFEEYILGLYAQLDDNAAIEKETSQPTTQTTTAKVTTTTVKTTATTIVTKEQEQIEKSKYYLAYLMFLNEVDATAKREYGDVYFPYYLYYLYDMNHDGFYELILHIGESEADACILIYTIDEESEDGFVELGELGGGHTILVEKDGNLYTDYCHQGYQVVEEIQMIGWHDVWSVIQETVFERDHLSDYISYGTAIKSYDISDTSAIESLCPQEFIEDKPYVNGYVETYSFSGRDGAESHLFVDGDFSYIEVWINCSGESRFLGSYDYNECDNYINLYFNAFAEPDSGVSVIPYDANHIAGEEFYCDIPVQTSGTIVTGGFSYVVDDRKGQINCHGGTVAGFTTDYVVNGGAVGKVRNSLGDTWHVTAKKSCYNYGITWYELWDSDDGDYYGWVDSNYIDFY